MVLSRNLPGGTEGYPTISTYETLTERSRYSNHLGDDVKSSRFIPSFRENLLFSTYVFVEDGSITSETLMTDPKFFFMK